MSLADPKQPLCMYHFALPVCMCRGFSGHTAGILLWSAQRSCVGACMWSPVMMTLA